MSVINDLCELFLKLSLILLHVIVIFMTAASMSEISDILHKLHEALVIIVLINFTTNHFQYKYKHNLPPA